MIFFFFRMFWAKRRSCSTVRFAEQESDHGYVEERAIPLAGRMWRISTSLADAGAGESPRMWRLPPFFSCTYVTTHTVWAGIDRSGPVLFFLVGAKYFLSITMCCMAGLEVILLTMYSDYEG